jgi:hypothetical protein
MRQARPRIGQALVPLAKVALLAAPLGLWGCGGGGSRGASSPGGTAAEGTGGAGGGAERSSGLASFADRTGGTSSLAERTGGAGGSAATATGAGAAGGSRGNPERAEGAARVPSTRPDPVASPQAGPPGMACEVRGNPIMTKGAMLFGAAQGGYAIASFAGQPVDLRTQEFPSAPTGRAKVRTAGGVRMEGWIDVGQLPMVADRDLPIVPGHVGVAMGVKAAFASASGGQLTTSVALSGPVNQTVRVTAPCNAYTFERRTRPPGEVPGSGRGYLPRSGEVPLYDDPNGSTIFTVHAAGPGAGLLFWSTETRGAFVHVLYREDLVIDAWARASDLDALKVGETMDQVAPSTSVPGSARLMVSGQPTIVRAVKDVPLRLTVKDGGNSPPIGFIEAGAEMYVMETVIGWSSVLPRALNVMPPTDHSFWVPAYEVGMGTAPGTKP